MNAFRYLYISLLLAALLPAAAFAQVSPAPAAPQSGPILLRNATLHLGNGQVIERGDLLFDKGVITAVGTVQAPPQARTVDLSGKHVYPGLVLIGSQLGLIEVSSVRATRDAQETGDVNPNARALVAYNTDSRIIPTVRSNGILIAQSTPAGGLFSGTSSVMQLDAWNYEDAAIRPDDALHVNWPSLSYRETPFGPPVETQKTRAREQTEEVYQTMRDAVAYRQAKEAGLPVAHNLFLESLVPVLKRERKVYVHASTEKQIVAAVEWIRTFGLDGVIFGAQEAYLQTALLKEAKIPVVIDQTHALPLREEDPVDLPYQLPYLLHEAGVEFALSLGDRNWNSRNLPFQAGTAAAFGLPKEAALQAVTLTPARLLGIGGRYGSLEAGKSATLIVSEGDLLDMRSSRVLHAFIDGRELSLDDLHKQLYERYKLKYSR
jgi:imidazolonepropionase-like amidohydrolase